MQERDNLDEAFDKLDEEDKGELNSLQKELSQIKDVNENNVQIVRDEKLKRRVAKCILKLLKQTGRNEELIRETSYIITGYFIGYRWEDELDEIIDMAGELEMPKEHVHGDIYDIFNEMKNKLEKYINS